jgi:DNA modification methylase
MKQVIKISQVKNNPNNPRVIKDHDFYVLVNSIKTTPGFMEFRPVIIDYNNMVLCGNQRLRACIYLGHKEIWTDLFTQEKADEMNKEAQKEGRPTKTYLEYCKAITIVDNTHAGTWDWDILANEWEQTELEGWGLDGFPFEDEVLEAEEDNFEVPDEIKTDIVLGDLFEIGEHRLLCGDSTDSDQVAKLMNGEKADMVFTDPPYGVSYQSNMRTKSEKFDVLENDNIFITEWINNLPLFSKGFVFVWTSWKVLKQWIEFCEPIGELSNIIVWDKGGGGIGDLKKTFSTDFEIALVYHRGAEIKGKRLGSVWSVGKDGSSTYLHPTQKPIELAAMAIENITYKNQLILDLFLGSGSTMVASHQLKRKCYGMELDPKYCQVIVDRMKKLDPNLVIKRNGINIE